MRGRWGLVIALVASCGAPAARRPASGTPAHSPGSQPPGRLARQPRPPAPTPPPDPSWVDPDSLGEWPVDATDAETAAGPTQVEIYATDAAPEPLLAPLLGAGVTLVLPHNRDFISGRLRASSDRAAIEAILNDDPSLGGAVLSGGKGQTIELTLWRVPVGFAARRIAERLGSSLIWAQPEPDEPVTVISRQAHVEQALTCLADSLDGKIVKRGDRWMVYDGRAAVLRLFQHHPHLIDLWLDDVPASAALDLVRQVASIALPPACIQQSVSLRLRNTALGGALAALVGAGEPNWYSHPPKCATPVWRGNRGPDDRDRLVGLVRMGRRRAALVETANGDYLLVHPGNYSHGTVHIEPTTLWITYDGLRWGGSMKAEPSPPRHHLDADRAPFAVVSAAEALTDLGPDTWRLAATMRIGGHWQGLVMSRAMDWAWIHDTDPGVRAIAADRLVVDAAHGAPPRTLRLAGLPPAGH